MKAIQVHQFGDPSVLQMRELPDLTPSTDEVVVSVRAIGVNPVETYIRAGNYPSLPPLPYVPGTDAAGEVSAIGEKVVGIEIGQRVYVIRPVDGTGAYATQVVAKSSNVFPLPNSASFAQGAALGIPYATAYRALFDRAKVVSGEVVLIHGATGGVGLAAVQLAVQHGCIVLGTGGTAAGRLLVQSFGAKEVFDHTANGYLAAIKAATPQSAGVHAIIEMAAHLNLDRDLDLLAKNGRIVTVGSRRRIEIDPRKTFVKETAILGMTLWGAGDEPVYRAHRLIVEGLRNGNLNPVIACEFPLAEVARAHEEMQTGQSPGKIVLLPSAS